MEAVWGWCGGGVGVVWRRYGDSVVVVWGWCVSGWVWKMVEIIELCLLYHHLTLILVLTPNHCPRSNHDPYL